MAYPDTHVFLLCFSLISPTSLENIMATWKPEVTSATPNAELVLVGTKADLRDSFDSIPSDKKNVGDRPVTREEAEEVAKKIGARHYVECSAMKNEGLTEVFHTAIKSVLNPRPKSEMPIKKSSCNLL